MPVFCVLFHLPLWKFSFNLFCYWRLFVRTQICRGNINFGLFFLLTTMLALRIFQVYMLRNLLLIHTALLLCSHLELKKNVFPEGVISLAALSLVQLYMLVHFPNEWRWASGWKTCVGQERWEGAHPSSSASYLCSPSLWKLFIYLFIYSNQLINI